MIIASDVDLILRAFRDEDRDDLANLANNPKVAQFLRDSFPSPYSVGDAEAWLNRHRGQKPLLEYAIEWRGRLAGRIGLEPMDDVYSGTSWLSHWLGEPFWGQGLSARAVGLSVSYVFDHFDFIRLQALVFSENKSAMRVLEKNGFRLEAVLRSHVRKHGRVMDAHIYGRLRDD